MLLILSPWESYLLSSQITDCGWGGCYCLVVMADGQGLNLGFRNISALCVFVRARVVFVYVTGHVYIRVWIQNSSFHSSSQRNYILILICGVCVCVCVRVWKAIIIGGSCKMWGSALKIWVTKTDFRMYLSCFVLVLLKDQQTPYASWWLMARYWLICLILTKCVVNSSTKFSWDSTCVHVYV